MSAAPAATHDVLIVGGGTAGITVAARLRRAGITDIAIVEPSDQHYYQPLWTLVGGGRAPASTTVRPEAGLIPEGVSWIRGRAADIDPEARTVATQDGQQITYNYLVVAPGLQLDFDKVPSLTETLGRNHVSSNYRFDLAPRTWDYIRDTTSGTALFTKHPAHQHHETPLRHVAAQAVRPTGVVLARAAARPGPNRSASQRRPTGRNRSAPNTTNTPRTGTARSCPG